MSRGGVAMWGQAKRKQHDARYSLTDLPEDLILHIILPMVVANSGHRDLVTLGYVCKSFFAFMNRDDLWKRAVCVGFGAAGRVDILRPPIVHENSLISITDYDKKTPGMWKKVFIKGLKRYRRGRTYLIYQNLMTPSIRSILVNWMLSVVDERSRSVIRDNFTAPHIFAMAHLRRTAQYRSISYLDRYFDQAKKPIERSFLQGIGAACVCIALHFTEPSRTFVPYIPLDIYSWVASYTAGACTIEGIKRQALHIQTTLSENISLEQRAERLPIPIVELGELSDDSFRVIKFAQQGHYSVGDKEDDELPSIMWILLKSVNLHCPNFRCFHLCHYLIELTLQSDLFLIYRPVTCALAIFALGCQYIPPLPASTDWKVQLHDIRKKYDVTIDSVVDCRLELKLLYSMGRGILKECRDSGEARMVPKVLIKFGKESYGSVTEIADRLLYKLDE